MVKYLISQIINTVSNISGKSKHNKAYIFLDMIICMIKYGASPNNYSAFEFYNLKPEQRRTYVTHRLSNKMIKQLNEDGYRNIFENKLKFAEKFNKYFERNYISSKCSENEFINFATNNKKAIYKPIHEAQANGINVLDLDKPIEKLKEIYLEIYNSSEAIIKQWITQHDSVSNIYPQAVSCLRIITVYDGENVNFLTGGVTFAVDGEIANGSKKV